MAFPAATSVTSEVTPNIYQVSIPVPLPLRFVNCYLIRGRNGWGLVDAGMRYPAAEQAWQQAFAELSLQPEHISTILLTHYHPDHYGMAGWLQQRTGAPVLMTPTEIEAVNLIWGRAPSVSSAAVCDFFRTYGMPADLAQAVYDQMVEIFPMTEPHADVTPFDPTADLTLGDTIFQPLQRGGHTDGHVCLLDEMGHVLLAGDHILPRITPNISLWPDANPDPLGDYIASLQEMRELEVALTLPAHGSPFTTYRQRCDEILVHHDERLDEMARLAGAGHTAFDISAMVFPTTELTPHQTRFAMAETLSHLARLEHSGRVRRAEHNGQIIFIDQQQH